MFSDGARNLVQSTKSFYNSCQYYVTTWWSQIATCYLLLLVNCDLYGSYSLVQPCVSLDPFVILAQFYPMLHFYTLKTSEKLHF